MVHSLSLRHGDPAPALAARLGLERAETRLSGMGGNIPQWLVNRAADLVAAGGRPWCSSPGPRPWPPGAGPAQLGVELDWPSSKGWPDTWPPIEPDVGTHPVEKANGLEQATTMYALVESALAHARRPRPEAQRRAMGDAHGPASTPWPPPTRSRGSPPAATATELTTATAENRMVCFPYPKYLNAVMDVDMGAAVLVTDAATARDWGLGPDEVAYIGGWADAKEVWYLSERSRVHTAPGLVECAGHAPWPRPA